MIVKILYATLFILGMFGAGVNLESKKYTWMFLSLGFGIIWLIAYTFAVLNLDVNIQNDITNNIFTDEIN